MYDRWSLDVLYKGLDDPKFEADRKKFSRLIDETIALADEWENDPKADAHDMTVRLMKLEEEAELVSSDLLGFLMLTRSTDMNNVAAASMIGVLESEMTRTAKAEAKFINLITSGGDLDKLIAGDSFLEEYRFYLADVFRQAEHTLSEDSEAMYSIMNLTGGSAWANLDSYLTSTLKVDYDGREVNLSTVRNLASDPDRSVRRAAYEAELAAYPKIMDPIAHALNNIKAQVNRTARERGYGSAIEQTLAESHMKRETLDAMIEAMDESMPKFREYMKAKAGYIGAGEALSWYDTIAPVGKSSRRFTKQEAHQYLLDSFSDFDEAEAEMMDRAFKEDWIDFDPRDGKEGGAFCAGLLGHNQSRICTNYDGSFDSVSTLAHELGHAYHNLQTNSHRPLNHSMSMQVAETASTFNETHITLKAVKEASGDEKLSLIDSFLANTTQVIVDIYSRYLFEKEVFERCENEFLMPAQLNDIMLRAQEASYGNGLNKEDRHPFMWVCKSHYYSESLSYYNFPYAFGAMFAMGLYNQYQNEGKSFVARYKKLLHDSTVLSVEDTAALAGIDVTRKEFWEESLASFGRLIDEFVGLVK
ncbi:MAG: M3 family oligoendopeptidase [Eubacteriaceae bacterium]|nr:M3 family oligoendopeptidase [Eubacteriaceae bacterium]